MSMPRTVEWTYLRFRDVQVIMADDAEGNASSKENSQLAASAATAAAAEIPQVLAQPYSTIVYIQRHFRNSHCTQHPSLLVALYSMKVLDSSEPGRDTSKSPLLTPCQGAEL